MASIEHWRERTRWTLVAAAAAGLGIALWILGNPQGGATQGAAPAPRETQTVAPFVVENSSPTCYFGVVLANEKVDVGATVEGQLEEVLVQVGDQVVDGQTLAVVTSDELRNAVAIEAAHLENARARRRRQELQVKESMRQHQRQQALVDIVSQAQVEEARYAYEVALAEDEMAAAEVVQVEARLRQLRELVHKLQITAPRDGTVAQRYLDTGALVDSGTPLFRILSAAGLKVRFAVPVQDAGLVEVGMSVRVELEGVALVSSGVIEHRAPEIDAASQMLFVTAGLADLAADPALPAGTIARVTLALPGATLASCLDSSSQPTSRPIRSLS